MLTRTGEAFFHGRELTPEERKRKKQLELQKREQFEQQRYGRVLSLEERRQAIRKEQIEHAEEAAHIAKLRAIEAERREADERARVPIERTRKLLGENRLKQLEPPLTQITENRLEPGERRTLQALQQAPQGLTVKQLGPLTKKDAMAEETPRTSLDVWLKRLEKKGLIYSQGKRPKTWMFQKDHES